MSFGQIFVGCVLLLVPSVGAQNVTEGKNETRLFFGLFATSSTPSPVVLPYERTCSCRWSASTNRIELTSTEDANGSEVHTNSRRSSKTDKRSCGETNDGTRIVGGVVTKPHGYPWMARLSYFNRFFCGATLINDRYVLSAAHCVRGFIWFMIKVTFGEHDRCDSTIKPESRFVLRAFIGRFSYLNFENDISLLRLNDRVPVTDQIRPICLPKIATELYAGKLASVLGWGTLKEDGSPSCTLRKVDLPVMSNDECKATNYTGSVIGESMMCAGFIEGGKDSCQGDSGGPLVYQRDDKKYEIIGVVSWGNGCARPGYPGIYTRVTRFLNWVIENSADGCYCSD